MRRTTRKFAETQRKTLEEAAKSKQPKAKPEIVEISSDSKKADSDYATFLETYTEETQSEEVESKVTCEVVDSSKSPDPQPDSTSTESE